jgi:hypothetical protein
MHPFANKFRILVRLGKMAILGIPLAILAAAFYDRSPLTEICGFLCALAVLPCFIYGYTLTILHWKARYHGRHSDLWGVLLLVEISGWFKLVYLFRHLLPDMKGQGRYGQEG